MNPPSAAGGCGKMWIRTDLGFTGGEVIGDLVCSGL